MKIFKYQLKIAPSQDIEIPEDHEIIHVANQDNTPTLWAVVDPDSDDGEKTILLVPTGADAPDTDDHTYLGTVLLNDGADVLHIYQVD